MKQILFLLLAASSALAQATGNATIALFATVPTGSCSARQLALNQSNGALYTCFNGTWQLISGGGGGGGWNPPSAAGNTVFGNNTVSTGAPSFFSPGGDVSFSSGNFSVNALHFGPTALSLQNTGIASGNYLQISGSTIVGATGTGGGSSGTLTSFSSGSLSPLFTTSVATATTTPALSFTLSPAPANTMLGNSSSSAAVPSWITIPTGGGGSGLTGCATSTPGALVCDVSVQGGTGTVGLLTLPYAPASLPSPPADAHAAIAADATGALYASTGNNNPFQPIGTGSGGGGNGSNISFPDPCNTAGYKSGQGTCADLLPNIQTDPTYTIAAGDINRVVMHRVNGNVVDTLPAPTGTMSAPFLFWIDTSCTATVTIQASNSLINGNSALELGACGWTKIWADADGLSWHAQSYAPAGGVVIVQ